MKYCTGLQCQHWGVIPENFHELKHALYCPKCNSYMGKVFGKSSPVKDAGYLEKDEVTPLVKFETTPKF